MAKSSDQQALHPSFDPFGEPLETVRAHATSPGDRRARIVAIAVFWGLALLLTAGRVHYTDEPIAQTLANLLAQASAVTAIH